MNAWPPSQTYSRTETVLFPSGFAHHEAQRSFWWPEATSGSLVPEETGVIPGTRVRQMARRRQSWLMHVRICDASNGYDTTDAEHVSPLHVLEWHLSAAAVQRVLPSGQGLESLPSNGFLVRPAHAPLAIVATGPLRFAEFCVTDEQVRKVAVDWMGDAGDREGLLGCDRVMRSDLVIVQKLDQYLRRALDEEEPPTRLEMDSRAHLILLQLLKHHSVLAEKTVRPPRGGLAPYHLKRVCERMTHDLTQEVALSELAATAGVSYHHFCHAFKASTGMAPHRWLVDRRVERACELLRTTSQSVTEIAAAVGYADPNQLLRVFRGRRSTTPAAYRRDFQAQGMGRGVSVVVA